MVKSLLHDRSVRGDFFMPRASTLVLSDGATFTGVMPTWQTETYDGEVVFNTGMTGYVESLTDPSYAGQILVFTYPLIGNYGVQLAAAESSNIHVRGVIVSEAAVHPSHADSAFSLLAWLEQQKVPILAGVDTRALTKHLRSRGSMIGRIGTAPLKPKAAATPEALVTIAEPQMYNETAKRRIILVDCGAKENIVRELVALGLSVKRVPFDYDYTNESYDGVFLSNGPGDPLQYAPTVAILKKALKQDKPIMGICLGSQLMGLAAGAKTYKLKYGHRGHNQPCLATADEQAFMTSQNHGFALDEATLPKSWRVSFRNLNDNSVEGIEHTSKPFFAVQFHPEACPGPTDTQWLFKKFYEAL